MVWGLIIVLLAIILVWYGACVASDFAFSCSQTVQLLCSPPSIWCADVATPHKNRFGNFSINRCSLMSSIIPELSNAPAATHKQHSKRYSSAGAPRSAGAASFSSFLPLSSYRIPVISLVT